LVLVVAVSLFYFESNSKGHGLLQERLTRTQNAAQEFYNNNIHYDANALRAIMDTLRHDDRLNEVFASYDRKAILEHTETLFKELKRDYNVTHFYFTKPDRTNLLRVHSPERHGDKIDRVTTLRAEEYGELVYGVELGVLGTLTLRVVSPWHDKQTGQLIGYIELGMEVDHIVSRLSDIFGFDVFVMIHKDVLDRHKWETGMKTLGRAFDWERFNQVVQSAELPREVPQVLLDWFERDEIGYRNEVVALERDGLSYRFMSIPIKDVSGRDVAQIILLADVSIETGIAERTTLVVGVTAFVIGGLLIVFFSWQAGRIGRRIEHDAKMLNQIATRDGLTGLYTRRAFDDYLDTELSRSSRFTHSVSLLLIDIDHFKRINDVHGHQAGDEILCRLSEILLKAARKEDYVCRYGGDELAIIVSETDHRVAEQLANRIKSMVTELPFETDNGQSIPITVSIGIASYPAHADTDISLISAADSALYVAKESGRNHVCTYTSDKQAGVIKARH
jgi:diguanylate cyclase (GGDEF)-like protein